MMELLTMSMKDLDRLRVIHTVLAGKLTWQEAAEQLTLSERRKILGPGLAMTHSRFKV